MSNLVSSQAVEGVILNERISLISAVIEMSSSFKCKHITYELGYFGSDKIIVKSTSDKNQFNATELIGTLDRMFNTYLKVEDDRVILVIF